MGKDPDTYYPKFLVIRRSNCEVIDPTTCFTLIPEHDFHALAALQAYCNSCENDMPGLASALRAHFGLDLSPAGRYARRLEKPSIANQ